MAITLTNLNGTDSIAASRITINDNFSTISASLNEALKIVNISTGKIDNWNFGGSDTSIETGTINTHGTISVATGNVVTQSGNIIASGAVGTSTVGYIELGLNSGVRIQRFQKALASGNIYSLDLSGTVGVTGATGSTGPIGYLTIPRQTTAVIQAIRNPQLGALVYNTSDHKLYMCTVTSSASGATGTWVVVGSQTA